MKRTYPFWWDYTDLAGVGVASALILSPHNSRRKLKHDINRCHMSTTHIDIGSFSSSFFQEQFKSSSHLLAPGQFVSSLWWYFISIQTCRYAYRIWFYTHTLYSTSSWKEGTTDPSPIPVTRGVFLLRDSFVVTFLHVVTEMCCHTIRNNVIGHSFDSSKQLKCRDRGRVGHGHQIPQRYWWWFTNSLEQKVDENCTENFSTEELRESPDQQVWSMGIWNDIYNWFFQVLGGVNRQWYCVQTNVSQRRIHNDPEPLDLWLGCILLERCQAATCGYTVAFATGERRGVVSGGW